MVLWGEGWSLALALVSLIVFLVVAKVSLKTVVSMLLLALIGYGLDALLAVFGLVDFRGQSGAWPPPWLVVVWLIFVVSLSFSLRWLAQLRWPICGVIGAIAGPLTYAGAANLGAMSFPDKVSGLLVMGLEWAVLLPFMVRVFGGLHAANHGRRLGCV